MSVRITPPPSSLKHSLFDASGFLWRPAHSSDTPAICRLFQEVHLEYGFLPDFGNRDADLLAVCQHFNQPGAFFGVLVHQESNQLVATAALKPYSELVCELSRLYLDCQYRGQGLGCRLVEEILSHAKGFGYQQIRLETHTAMPEAIALYRKLGFIEIAPYHQPVDPGYTDIAFELVL